MYNMHIIIYKPTCIKIVNTNPSKTHRINFLAIHNQPFGPDINLKLLISVN